MITINATGDTTLHTAGKYCTEDILVKVPAGSGGGSGGGTIETCTGICTCNAPGGFGFNNTTFWYTDGNLNAQTLEATSGSSISIAVAKNTIVVASASCGNYDNCQGVGYYGSGATLVTGNNFKFNVTA